jgi:hypothetical protein
MPSALALNQALSHQLLAIRSGIAAGYGVHGSSAASPESDQSLDLFPAESCHLTADCWIER